ncbi:hypothetical protein [Streptosporangium sp. NPDC049046]|uniref:DUF7676 family protein n=1 Tax=unclassified Streptosporangium TaxID=2632669 RepID=UPI00341EB1C7
MSHTVVEEHGTGTLHVWALPTDERTLLSLVTDIFEHHWEHIWFGVIVQGAAWEVAAPNAPERISLYDGYVTVDFGRWHFHLCIGEHTASGPELGRIRRCARAELYRSISADGHPVSWGMRMFNGQGDQLMTVLLPNPFLTDRQQILDPPDYDRLIAWDELRAAYLGIGPDPLDRAGKGFKHG